MPDIIKTVQDSKHRYLVNAKHEVPKDPDNSDYVLVQEWIAAGNFPAPEVTDVELFDNAIIKAGQCVSARATKIRAAFADNADSYKVAGWVLKVERARKIIAGTPTDHDLKVMAMEISQRDKSETIKSFSKKVIDQESRMAIAAAAIDGMESAGLSSLNSCTDIKEINDTVRRLETACKNMLHQLKRPF